jgi:resuscitation-promoting factor RpfA
MALPLLTAGGAQAADNVTWTAVALCESGAEWSSNTGNGFYGGLQISQATWDEYGGQEYAKRPDLASISQQMEVADKILAALGPEAWPRCAEKAGLERDDSGASRSRSGSSLGAVLSPAPGGSEGGNESGSGSGSRGSSGGSHSGSHPGAAPPSTSSPSGSSSGARSDTPPRGRADTPSQTGPQRSQTDPHSQPEPEAEAAWGVLARDQLPLEGRTFAEGSARESAQESAQAVTYRVRAGDTLCGIAVEEGLSWRELYHANKTDIGDDPRLIRPGQYLRIER